MGGIWSEDPGMEVPLFTHRGSDPGEGVFGILAGQMTGLFHSEKL